MINQGSSNLPGNYKPKEMARNLDLAREHLRKAVTIRGKTGPYLFTLARADFMAGDYLAAREEVETSLNLEPKNYEALLLLAEIQLRLKETHEAWKTAKQAIKLTVQREEAWLIAARAAVETGQSNSAIECLDLYFKINKDRINGPLAYILLARVFLDTGLTTQAMEQLEPAQARLRESGISPGPAFLALRAKILGKLGHYSEALESYGQALKLAPQDSILYNEMGEALLEQNEPGEAMKAFRQAMELDVNNPVFHCNAGLAALKLAASPDILSKRVESYRKQAVELTAKATELDSLNPRYWYELARAQEANRNYNQVKQSLDQALNLSPAFTEITAPQANYLNFYARTSEKLGDVVGAQKALNQILATVPEDHNTFNRLGELYYRNKDYEEAYNHFRRAELLSPGNSRYVASMSRVMLRMGRLQEAHELVEEAAAANFEDYFVRHQLGAVLLESGKPGEALEHLHVARVQEPENPEFHYYLGRAYLGIELVNEAIEEYRGAVTFDPTRSLWHAELGELYLLDRSPGPALDCLRLAVQLEPTNPTYRYNLAIALAGTGDFWGAVHTIREVIGTLKDEVGAEWHYVLGRIFLELNRLEEAFVSFSLACEMEPSNPLYKVDLAKTLRLKGEPVESVKNLLKEALITDPLELRSADELAYTYESLKEHEAAIQAMETHIDGVLEAVLKN